MAILKRQLQERESNKFDTIVDDYADIMALVEPQGDDVGSTVFVANTSEVYMKNSTGWGQI